MIRSHASAIRGNETLMTYRKVCFNPGPILHALCIEHQHYLLPYSGVILGEHQ